MNLLIRLRRVTPLFFIALAVLYFGILPKAQAVIPPPDGGYPGGNTAEGQAALLSLTTGGFNTAVGFFSLRSDTTGSFNTAIGAGALLANTSEENTAVGAGALLSNVSSAESTAVGAFALLNAVSGANTAIGWKALFNNTTGFQNTAVGAESLNSNITGNFNTAIGAGALPNNTSGGDNIAVGLNAGSNVVSANHVICIGHSGADVDGSCFINQIFGKAVGNDAVTVMVDSFGKLGTMVSSRRFKNDIKPMNKASEAILELQPVTFHYKDDKTKTPRFGLVAEEVAEINPDLVVRDERGELLTVRYEAVNAMLLNEFLKEHRKNEEQEATIARLQKQIEALTAGLQKVSGQLELTKAAPQMVTNNH